jgi:hypothetical protein
MMTQNLRIALPLRSSAKGGDCLPIRAMKFSALRTKLLDMFLFYNTNTSQDCSLGLHGSAVALSVIAPPEINAVIYGDLGRIACNKPDQLCRARTEIPVNVEVVGIALKNPSRH